MSCTEAKESNLLGGVFGALRLVPSEHPHGRISASTRRGLLLFRVLFARGHRGQLARPGAGSFPSLGDPGATSLPPRARSPCCARYSRPRHGSAGRTVASPNDRSEQFSNRKVAPFCVVENLHDQNVGREAEVPPPRSSSCRPPALAVTACARHIPWTVAAELQCPDSRVASDCASEN